MVYNKTTWPRLSAIILASGYGKLTPVKVIRHTMPQKGIEHFNLTGFKCTNGYILMEKVSWCNVRLSVRPFHMSRSNLRTPWPIHFKFHRVIGIDGLAVCILYDEISNFHSRVMGLYSSNCRQFSINSNNYAKFEVNWPRGFEFTARHTKNRLQFDE
jgi:hypothetical protein